MVQETFDEGEAGQLGQSVGVRSLSRIGPARLCVYMPARLDYAMAKSRKDLIVVGDRVLVAPEEGEERTNVGLYLPPTAVDRQAVQSGRIVATGPGTPLADPTELDDEPWKISGHAKKYVPMQARVGDYALFFRKAAVEISYEEKKYLVIPQAAILVLLRSKNPIDDL